jgi:phenylpropionate dioxygenase-like ring-hydroxylating dioxygenase large terminal subunit
MERLAKSQPKNAKIDGRHYSCQKVTSYEFDHLFKKTWQFFCFSSEFDKTNVVAQEMFGVPVIVAKQRDGRFKAFYNICPHRGSTIVENGESIKGEFIVCRYHAWCFSTTNGECSIDRTQLVSSDDHQCDVSLKSIQCDSVGAFVFIKISDQFTETLSDYLRELESEILSVSKAIDFNKIKKASIKHSCNWKHIVENVVDNKHCDPVHKLTLSKIGFCKNKPETKLVGLHSLFVIQPGDIELANKRNRFIKKVYPNTEENQYYKHILIWPNLTVSIFEGVHYTVGYIVPESATSSTYVTFYGRPHIANSQLSAAVESDHVESAVSIFNEDVAMLNKLRNNLAIAGLSGHVYADEARIIQFQCNYMKYFWEYGEL